MKSKYDISDSDIILEAYQQIDENLVSGIIQGARALAPVAKTVGQGLIQGAKAAGQKISQGVKTITPKIKQAFNNIAAKVGPAINNIKQQIGQAFNQISQEVASSQDYNTAVNAMYKLNLQDPQTKPTLDNIVNSINAMGIEDDNIKLQILQSLLK